MDLEFHKTRVLTDEDVEKYIADLKIKREIQDKRLTSIRNFIESLSEDEMYSLMDRFINWEKAYQEMWYKRGVETDSNLLNRITDLARDYGIQQEPLDDFQTLDTTWKGYRFKLYMGQGSFWRIYKDDIIIF